MFNIVQELLTELNDDPNANKIDSNISYILDQNIASTPHLTFSTKFVRPDAVSDKEKWKRPRK